VKRVLPLDEEEFMKTHIVKHILIQLALLVLWCPDLAFANNSPQAIAGNDQSVNMGDTISLDGSESYDEDTDDVLTYAWQIASHPNDSQILEITNDDQVKASFTPDVAGTYILKLYVRDGNGGIDSDDVTITANTVADTSAAPATTTSEATVLALEGGGNRQDGNCSLMPRSDKIPNSVSWMLFFFLMWLGLAGGLRFNNHVSNKKRGDL